MLFKLQSNDKSDLIKMEGVLDSLRLQKQQNGETEKNLKEKSRAAKRRRTKEMSRTLLKKMITVKQLADF